MEWHIWNGTVLLWFKQWFIGQHTTGILGDLCLKPLQLIGSWWIQMLQFMWILADFTETLSIFTIRNDFLEYFPYSMHCLLIYSSQYQEAHQSPPGTLCGRFRNMCICNLTTLQVGSRVTNQQAEQTSTMKYIMFVYHELLILFTKIYM